jgi:hypothetical protein
MTIPAPSAGVGLAAEQPERLRPKRDGLGDDLLVVPLVAVVAAAHEVSPCLLSKVPPVREREEGTDAAAKGVPPARTRTAVDLRIGGRLRLPERVDDRVGWLSWVAWMGVVGRGPGEPS